MAAGSSILLQSHRSVWVLGKLDRQSGSLRRLSPLRLLSLNLRSNAEVRYHGFYGFPGGELLAIFAYEGRMSVLVRDSEWTVRPQITADALPAADHSEFLLLDRGTVVASIKYRRRQSLAADIDPTYEFDDFHEDFPAHVASIIKRSDDQDFQALVSMWSRGLRYRTARSRPWRDPVDAERNG